MSPVSTGRYHEPVMAGTVVRLFQPVPEGVVVDATIGTGGHSEALLAACDQVSVAGIDRDAEALAIARLRLAPFGDRVKLIHGRFSDMEKLLVTSGMGTDSICGVLLDLGISSLQVGEASRGFSYMADGPLDMRMDASQGMTAADIVNEESEQYLTKIFIDNGEYRNARRVAKAIVSSRPLQTTGELVRVITGVSTGSMWRRKGHPAKRFFQALRTIVNEEQAELAGVLDDAVKLLMAGGRLVVISYHSGEDQVVKESMARAVSGGCKCLPQLPCQCGAISLGRLVFRGTRKPLDKEVAFNPRSRSARLRAFERVQVDGQP
ncbi:MAG: 16S rRNA (cytosine(1402)-N(4))-methyltransferase RsmH [Actinobacteria bacterium]|nr:16S rRNA (cytosine(1402)-N(4))-methyltransferase RsmH [Actinomycetota bacterium]MCL5446368.1 16S rRNA (cytosine(1402)-N(4))-methyltransferase RsmH [Actinomycetota bacterium]